MKAIDFNDGWTVRRLGMSERPRAVCLPHDAALEERRCADAAGGKNTGWFEGSDYLYEKRFPVPDEWENRHIVLEFEGVYRHAEVYLNGKKAAFHPYGYTGFAVDADAFLEYGRENTVSVIARNADQPNSRWYSGAGIYRPVWLYVLPEQYIEPGGIRIRTLSVDPPRIQVRVVTGAKVSIGGRETVRESNPVGKRKQGEAERESLPKEGLSNGESAEIRWQVKMEILDGAHVLAHKSVSVSSCFSEKEGMQTDFLLEHAQLWSPDHPRLYICRVTYGEDVQETTFGMRHITCDRARGFCVNGKRIVLRGACIHHDNGLLGAVAHPFAEERKVRLLMENGYNAIRSAHNPCSHALLDACDRLGMLVMDEYADMWYLHKTPYDYAAYAKDCWRGDLADMVRKDYNHPSVVLYSIGNEIAETAQPEGIAMAREMREYLHEMDDRPVTCAVNPFFNYLGAMGGGVYGQTEETDKPSASAATVLKNAWHRINKPRGEKKKLVGSEFYNHLAGIFGAKVMKLGAVLPGSDRNTREVYAHLDIAGYNYGIDRYRKDLRKYPERVILGTETFCFDNYQFWELAKHNPGVIGDFVWTGIDYLGEVGIGAWEFAEYVTPQGSGIQKRSPDFHFGAGWLTAGAGRLDLTGRPFGEAAYTQVVFEQSSIRMAVVPANHTFDRHSPSAWRMTNAIESWSWNRCEGKRTRVEVYSHGFRVALFLNGRKLAEKKAGKACRTTFLIKWYPGKLTAAAFDETGKEISRTSLKSAGEDTRLTLFPERKMVTAEELCYVRLRYTDSDGEIKPLIRGEIHLSVSGGKLLGLGSGCPYNEKGFLSDRTDTYYGEALAIIRPKEAGKIEIYAESPYGSARMMVPVL